MPSKVMTNTEIREVKHLHDILLRYGSRIEMENGSIERIRVLLGVGDDMNDERLRQKVQQERELYKGLLMAADPWLLHIAATELNKKYLLNSCGK